MITGIRGAMITSIRPYARYQPQARSGNTMATPTMSSAISACCRRHNVIGRATHRVSENRTLTKISQDCGQRLNSFMILSVTEWEHHQALKRFRRIGSCNACGRLLILFDSV